LEVSFPEGFDLAEYAIEEEGRPVWEWVVPAEVVNSVALVRLLTDEEIEALLAAS
jgi:hypothetical protein